MYNKVIMVGNLVRDIDLRYLPSGVAIAKSAIATSYKYKDQAGNQKDEVCFLDFNMFGRSGEVANQYLRKGSKVLLEGRLVFEQWTAQDGTNRSKHSLRVDTMKMLDSRSDSSTINQNSSSSYANQNSSSSYANQNSGDYTAQKSSAGVYNNMNQSYSHPGQEKPIPEIDIDEQEIPF